MKNFQLILVKLCCALFTTSNLCSQQICSEGDYRFKWHSEFIKSGNKGYACDYSLPDTLTIVDHNGAPVAANVTWTNATNIIGQFGWNNRAIINTSNFGSGFIATVNATFNYPSNEPHTMVIDLHSDVTSTIAKYKSLTTFAIDSNDHPEYFTYNTGIYNSLPHKFLLPSTLDKVKADLNHKKAFYAPFYSSPTTSSLKFYPNRFTTDTELLEHEFDGTLSTSDTLKSLAYSCSTDPEAVIFIGDPIDKTVTFIYLCDSSGLRPKPLNITRIMLDANEIYNTAGLFLTEYTTMWDTVNYDIDLDGVFSLSEQRVIHDRYKETADSIYWESDYLVWIVKDLGTVLDTATHISLPIRGRATRFFDNSMALDYLDSGGGSTLAHEIGHAAFGLRHPHEIKPIAVHDTYNFMYKNNARIDNVRAYQFITIHRRR